MYVAFLLLHFNTACFHATSSLDAYIPRCHLQYTDWSVFSSTWSPASTDRGVSYMSHCSNRYPQSLVSSRAGLCCRVIRHRTQSTTSLSVSLLLQPTQTCVGGICNPLFIFTMAKTKGNLNRGILQCLFCFPTIIILSLAEINSTISVYYRHLHGPFFLFLLSAYEKFFRG